MKNQYEPLQRKCEALGESTLGLRLALLVESL